MHIVKNLVARTGSCLRCLRIAFLAAVAAWALFIALQASAPALLADLAFAAASALSALWIAHAVGFAIRTARRKRAEMDQRQTGDLTPATDADVAARRTLGGMLLKAAAVAVLASALPRKAAAQIVGVGSCGAWCNHIEPNQRRFCARGFRPYYFRGGACVCTWSRDC